MSTTADSANSACIQTRSGLTYPSPPETNSNASELSDPSPDVDSPMTLNLLVAIVKSGFSDITATLNKQQEAIQDLQTQIPHNVASGVTFVSKDLHQKLQYHTSTESKNHSDMTDRINQIESATPDPVLIRTVTALNSTMEKLMTVLTRMQQSADTQSKATLHIQEMSFNQVQAPADDSCLTMIKSFHSYRNYKSGGGSMNFYELVKRSPDVLELYLEKARKFQYNFFFNMEDDTIFFHELLDRVFYPDGVTVEAFNQLVSSKKMTEFTFQAASSFKTWIYYLTKTLCDQLPEALIHQLWDRVSRNAFPNSFQYSLLSHPPRNLKDFAKTIEARAAIFRDNGQRSHHDSSHTNSNQSGANDSASTHHRSPPSPSHLSPNPHNLSRAYERRPSTVNQIGVPNRNSLSNSDRHFVTINSDQYCTGCDDTVDPNHDQMACILSNSDSDN